MEGLREDEMHDLAADLYPNEAVVEMVRRCKRCLQTAPSDPTAEPGIACSDNMTAIVVQIPEEPKVEQAPEAAEVGAVLPEEPASVSLDAPNTQPAEGDPNA